MISADILGNRRPGMIAGAAALHLAVLAGAWIAIPPGIVTRLDRPIEASFAPMPSADQVNAASTPLAEEVTSTVEKADPAPEQTARMVTDDAAAAEPLKATGQSAIEPVSEKPLQPDDTAAPSAPSVQPPVRSERAMPSPAQMAVASSPPVQSTAPTAPPVEAAPAPAAQAAEQPSPTASAMPEMITALVSEQEVASPATIPRTDPVPAAIQPAPEQPAKPEAIDANRSEAVKPTVVKPEVVKVETGKSEATKAETAKPKIVERRMMEHKPVELAPKQPRKMASRQAKTRDVAEAAPKARPAQKTVLRRARQGGAGAVSDVGVSDNARRSGATSRNYDAVILAQVRRHLRFPPGARDRGVEGTATVSFVVSGQGAVGGVHLARSSNDSTLDAAALALMRGLSLPPPPYHPYVRTVPVHYNLQ